MRVIGGSARGRRLFPPKDERVRPTADKVKEALFSILYGLMGTFEGAYVLDIFAGTGNLGIEALSRGAEKALFIDSHRESVGLIKKNLDSTGFAPSGRIIAREAATAIKLLEAEGRVFDLVLLDPPYRQGLAQKTLEILSASTLIDSRSIVAAETDSTEKLPDRVGALELFDRRRYGDTTLAFLHISDLS